jgi:hypothetical protein
MSIMTVDVCREALSRNDHEVGDGIFGVSPACRVANFMINSEGVSDQGSGWRR